MNIYDFPPIAAVLDAAYSVLTGLAALLAPVAGATSATIAIVLITIAVRGVLLPLGEAQVRAEVQRRRLAPKLRELQRRYAKKPELLQKKTLELYKEENASPFAGILPALAQAPVLSILYGVFVLTQVNGHGNALLDETLLGVPLGHSFLAVLNSPTAWPGAMVPLALLLVIAAVAFLTRSQTIALAESDALARGSDGAPNELRITRMMASLSFLTVIFSAIVPLAATVYLAVTTVWTFSERTVLRRRAGILPPLSRRAPSVARAASE